MKREEEIKQASKSYASKMCDLCLDEYCKEKGLVCHQFKEYVAAYSKGVKWADEHPQNVWHSADEEPAGGYWRIICQDEEGGCWVENRNDAMRLHNTWNEYVAIELIVKWAYIKDLLPKGGDI